MQNDLKQSMVRRISSAGRPPWGFLFRFLYLIGHREIRADFLREAAYFDGQHLREGLAIRDGELCQPPALARRQIHRAERLPAAES